MATGSPAAEQTTDLLQKLSLDPQTNTAEVPEATNKKPSPIKCGSVDGEVPSGPMSFREQSTTPSHPDYMDPNLCYLPNGYPSATYYCPGFDGPMNEWEDYTRYVGPDGVEMPPPGVYGDNGSLMYQPGYGYAPYGAYSPAGSPVPTMGHDGQLYGSQHYQFPAPYYVPPTPSDAMYTHNQVATPQGEVSTSVAADQAPLSVEKGNGNAKGSENVNINGPVPLRPGYSNSFQAPNGSYGRGMLQGGVGASGYQDPGFRYDGLLFSDGHQRPMTSSASSATIPSSRNQNLHTLPHLTGLQPSTASGMGPGYVNSMYPNNRVSGHFGNMVRTGAGFACNGFDFRANGRGWLHADNKYRSRGQGNGIFGYSNESADGLNELNRGPRAGRFKNQKGIGPNVTIAVKGQNLSSHGKNDESGLVPDRDQYNQPGFPIEYSDAKFFVIKSYSEDDIHRSIKYGVWASTPNGNKKLDAAYREAQEKSEGCPVFLLFSVNTSGQFVGLAEMGGTVDFNKKVEYWQQDKWIGCFPVKWHIVKDVPNSLLKHITLENNDNKPVTNSRDTQEVKIQQGLEMLKIFKDHVSKTCIFDDFGFYEGRQKAMQERKAKLQPIQKQLQVPDVKPVDASSNEKHEDGTNSNARLQDSVELPKVANKEAIQGIGDHGLSEENDLVAGARDAPKGAKPATEESLVDGIANDC